MIQIRVRNIEQILKNQWPQCVVVAVGLIFLTVSLFTVFRPAQASDILTSAPVVKALAAGGEHACAIYNDSQQVYCWGNNNHGQLGNGDTSGAPQSRPVAVDTTGVLSGLTVKDVTAGFYHTCVIAGNATDNTDDWIYCWGSNDSGQLGNGSIPDQYAPVNIIQGSLSGTPTDVVAGFATTCALVGTSTYCWGDDSANQYGYYNSYSGTPINTGFTMDSLAIGTEHICGLRSGAVYCLGGGGSGQLGNGSDDDISVPTTVSGDFDSATPTQVAVGFFYSCALTDDGSVWCWGDDTSGEIGGGGNVDVPTKIIDGLNITNITGGYAHICAVLGDGSAKCWGENASGQLGDGTIINKTAPTAVDKAGVLDGLTIKYAAAGFDFTCFVAGNEVNNLSDAVYCTGQGDLGQLGDDLATDSDVPTAVDTYNVPSEIYITLTNSKPTVNLSISPTSAGAEGSDYTKIRTTTNNTSGYNLSIKATEPDLVCATDGTKKIASLSTPGTLDGGTWGYGVVPNNVTPTPPSNWDGLPDSNQNINTLSTATAPDGDNTTVYFGAKVDYTLVACQYSTAVTFTAAIIP